MTRDDVMTLLRLRLEGRTDLDDRIVAEMKFAQSVVMEANPWLPWFLITEDNTLSTVAGVQSVDLPSDFLAEFEEGTVSLTIEGKVIPLTKKDMSVALRQFPGQGTPQVYSVVGESVLFFPCPDAVYPISLVYYGRDVDMTLANVETAWLKHAADVVVALVGQAVATKHIMNQTLAASFSSDIAPAWTRLLDKHTAYMEENVQRYLGGNS